MVSFNTTEINDQNVSVTKMSQQKITEMFQWKKRWGSNMNKKFMYNCVASSCDKESWHFTAICSCYKNSVWRTNFKVKNA